MAILWNFYKEHHFIKHSYYTKGLKFETVALSVDISSNFVDIETHVKIKSAIKSIEIQ
jgi:hypothetical protein